tara:strand:- start:132 stop:254 length:123 start_codon:yes stop_codon:yes gene_type:complete
LKKKKLNSKNPKWLKEKEKKVKRKLIKEIKGVKIYAVWEL